MRRRMRSSNRIRTKDLVIAGLLLAIGVIIPSIFHTTGIPGTVFLPMHISVLLAGFLLPIPLAFLVGVLTPLLNSLITGMPAIFPMMVIMMVELGFYGLIASLLYRRLRMPSLISLIISMILGRLVAGVTVFLLIVLFTVQMDPVTFIKVGVLTGLPGIIIQLILIPVLMHIINRYTTINLD